MNKRASSASPVVEARGISKKFGARFAVDHLDLEVPARVCFGLLGPNGAGKTTTLRMIYGVTRGDKRPVRVFRHGHRPACAGGSLRGSASPCSKTF